MKITQFEKYRLASLTPVKLCVCAIKDLSNSLVPSTNKKCSHPGPCKWTVAACGVRRKFIVICLVLCGSKDHRVCSIPQTAIGTESLCHVRYCRALTTTYDYKYLNNIRLCMRNSKCNVVMPFFVVTLLLCSDMCRPILPIILGNV